MPLGHVTIGTPASEFRSLTGKGVTGLVGGRWVALGNRRLMEELGVVARSGISDQTLQPLQPACNERA